MLFLNCVCFYGINLYSCTRYKLLCNYDSSSCTLYSRAYGFGFERSHTPGIPNPDTRYKISMIDACNAVSYHAVILDIHTHTHTHTKVNSSETNFAFTFFMGEI